MHKLQTGGPLRIYAQDWNLLCDMVEQIRKGEENLSLLKSAIRTYVQVYNPTEEVAEDGTVWELGAPLISPSDNIDEFQKHPVFSIVKPESETEKPLCVLTAPINAGEQGIGVVTGTVAVKCTVTSDADQWAKPDGNGGMTTGTEGKIRLVYADAQTGWCYAILGAGGGGSSYNGYFKTSIKTTDDVKTIHVGEGRFFINGAPYYVDECDIEYNENCTVLLNYSDTNGASIVTGSPFQWGETNACTVIAHVVNGAVRQICHDMPVLWLMGDCDNE